MFKWLRQRGQDRRDAAALAHYADWLRPRGGNHWEWACATDGLPILRTDRFADDEGVPLVATTYLLGSSKRNPTDSAVLLVVAIAQRGKAPDGSTTWTSIEIARTIVDFPTGQNVLDVSVLAFLEDFLHRWGQFQYSWVSAEMRNAFYGDIAQIARYGRAVGQSLGTVVAPVVGAAVVRSVELPPSRVGEHLAVELLDDPSAASGSDGRGVICRLMVNAQVAFSTSGRLTCPIESNQAIRSAAIHVVNGLRKHAESNTSAAALLGRIGDIESDLEARFPPSAEERAETEWQVQRYLLVAAPSVEFPQVYDAAVRALIAKFRAGPMGPASAPHAIDRFGGVARLADELGKFVADAAGAAFRRVLDSCGVTADAPTAVKDEFFEGMSADQFSALFDAVWAELFDEIWAHAKLWRKSDPQLFVDELFDHSARVSRTSGAAREYFLSLPELVRYFHEVKGDETLDQSAKIARRAAAAFERRGCGADVRWMMSLAPVGLEAKCFNRAALEAAGAVDEDGVVIG